MQAIGDYFGTILRRIFASETRHCEHFRIAVTLNGCDICELLAQCSHDEHLLTKTAIKRSCERRAIVARRSDGFARLND